MAFTTAKMGLRVWNLLTDLYDHTQLADNWAKLDYHDHSPGKGVQIPTEGLADGAVTGPKLAAALDPSAAYTSPRLLVRLGGNSTSAFAAGTYPLRTDFAALVAVPVQAAWTAVYLDPAMWTATGRTVRYLLRGALITNAVAPTATYAFTMQPVATWAGGSGSSPTTSTLGPVVTGATTPSIAAPAAGGPATPVEVEFDAPAAGWYTLCMVQTGAAAANSLVAFHSSLFVKQV